MAFPWLFEENFELGTLGDFDAESDSATRLDFPSYKELARYPGVAMPWRGAYCMRVLLNSTTDAYVQETGSFDTSASGTIYARFMIWVGSDITMAASDLVSVFSLWSATNTVEGTVMIRNNAGVLEWALNETHTATAASTMQLVTDKWTCVEVGATIDSGGGDDGTLDCWIDGVAMTQLTGLDQGAITSAVFGAMSQDAGTTAGTLLFDAIVADDARVYPPAERYTTEMLLTQSGHVFVGGGEIDNVTLLSGAGTDCVLDVYDTDEADVTDHYNRRARLLNTANNEVVDSAGMPITVKRGCFIQLAGTNPQAIVKIKHAVGIHGDGRVRNLARRNAA